MTGWIAIGLAGLGSCGYRLGGLSALARTTTPASVDRALSHFTSAALGVIVASAIFSNTAEERWSIGTEQVAIVAAL